MHVALVMNRELTFVSPETTLEDLVCHYGTSRSRLLYVVDADGRLAGIITTYDLLDALLPLAEGVSLSELGADEAALTVLVRARARGKTADDIMLIQVQGLSPDDLVVEAHEFIRERGVTALPVLDEAGRPVGEVTRHHVLAYLRRICGPQADSGGLGG